MKIKYKLFFSIMFSAIMIIGLAAVSYDGVKKIDAKFNELVEFPIPSILRLTNMTEEFLLSVGSAHLYLMNGVPTEKEKYFTNIEKFDEHLDGIKKDLHYGTPDILEDDTVFIDKIFNKVETIKMMFLESFDNRMISGDMYHPEAIDLFSKEQAEVIDLLHQYVEMEKEEILHAKTEVDKESSRIINVVIISSILFLMLLAFINYFIAKSIIKPLRLLGDAAEKFGTGDFESRVAYSSKDELGVLANIFNKMATGVQQAQTILELKIKERTSQLEAAKLELEKAVKERTDELEKNKLGLENAIKNRTDELESKLEEFKKLNTIMTGREVKMVELKEENDKLKEKLNLL